MPTSSFYRPYICRFLSLLALLLLTGARYSQAQVGPVIDASLPPLALYQPAVGRGACQLSDGSRIVVGDFNRAEGQPSSGLTRYLPGGQPDAGFNARTQANSWRVEAVREAPGGKLLVQFADTARVSGRLCIGLVRLMPNGRRDSTFVPALSLPMQIDALLVLPDGSVLLGAASRGLIRLRPDGTLDSAFQPAIQGGDVFALARQDDGRLLVGGDFTEVQGQPRPGLARLRPSGVLDTAYDPELPPDSDARSLTVQPSDGAILCLYFVSPIYGRLLMARLLPATGALDSSFQLDPTVTPNLGSRKWPVVQVQANGGILLSGMQTPPPGGGLQQSFIIRLTPTGTYDNTWRYVRFGNLGQAARSLQVLPSGEVLVAASQPWPFSANGPVTTVALLDAAGTPMPGFSPLLLMPGYISSLALQPDGRILVAGIFSELNGRAVPNVARLLPDGTLDASFGTTCPGASQPQAFAGFNEPKLALQPDGKVLVSGLALPASPSVTLLRLLSNGCPDPSFAPALALGIVTSLSQQPDGQVLITGILASSGGSNFYGARLTSTGAVDATYQPASSGWDARVVAQPDGSALVANGSFNSQQAPALRLLPNGTRDPGWTVPTLVAGTAIGTARGVYRDASGRQLLYGWFSGVPGISSDGMVRLLADGTPDPGFQARLFAPGTHPEVTAVAEQPNGRILVGTTSEFRLQRLLPDGSLDGSFDPTQGPRGGSVRAIAVQPNGAILVAGTFTSVGAQPYAGLVRLLDPNVLRVAGRASAARTAAWPVPAHDVLHLSLDAQARPRAVQLLDALGRVALAQAVTQPEMSLTTAALAPGIYVLRVDYATGPVTRRVVLE